MLLEDGFEDFNGVEIIYKESGMLEMTRCGFLSWRS
jgi:hypothetical protein